MRAGQVLASAVMVTVLALVGCSKHRQPRTGAGVTASKAQTTCPVMEGNPINRSLYVDHDGKRVYFCCAACVDTFKADPEKYVEKLEDQGVVLEDAPAANP